MTMQLDIAFLTLCVLIHVTKVQCCQNKTSVICVTLIYPYDTIPCEEPICSCSGRYTAHDHFWIKCTGVFEEIPTEIPTDVMAIDFQYNNFTTIPGGAFNGLRWLYTMYLSNNNIDTIQNGSFSGLPSLGRVEITHNNITTIEGGSFSDYLSALGFLKLSNNKLNRIKQATFKDLPVFNLYLDNNDITVIEKGAFDNLPNLGHLNLSSQNITTIETQAFSNLPNFEAIFLSDNKLPRFTDDIFFGLPKLTIIDISGNMITVVESHAFDNLDSVKIINISRNIITVIESYTFENLNNLEYIDLSRQNITTIQTQAFSNLPNFEAIYLSDNKLPRFTGDIFFGLPKLSMIDISGNMITVVESHAFDNLDSVKIINISRNIITVIESYAFENLNNLEYINFWGNEIQVIQSKAFNSLPNLAVINNLGVSLSELQAEAFWNLSSVQHISLHFKEKTSIKERTFWNLDKVNSIVLSGNSVPEIESYAFCNLPTLKAISFGVQSVNLIKRYAFCNLPALSDLIMSNLLIHDIKPNAFWNVHGSYLVLGIANDFVMAENTNMNFSTVVFYKNPVSCNCSFMWFSLWKQEQRTMSIEGVCSMSDYPVSKLVPENFTHCYDTKEVAICNSSETIQLQCPSAYVTSNVKQWIHTRNGRFIRSWTTQALNSFNILEINKCGQADAGEYTCVRVTNYTALTEFNSTLQLTIRGVITLQEYSYCNKSSRIEIVCSVSVGGSISTYWTHSSKGTTIRKMNGAIGNNMNTLVIPFCSFQDIGEYTCSWEFTDGVILHKTSMLVVNGPPVITSTTKRNVGKDKIISVLFYSNPHPKEPSWYYNSKQVIIGQTFLQNTEFGDVDVRQHGVYVKLQGFITSLTLVDMDSSSYGQYRCMITNSYGSTETDIDVTLDIAPDSKSQLTLVVAVASASSVSITIAIATAVICMKRRKRHTKDGNYQEPCQPSDNAGYDDMKIQYNRDSSAQYDFIEMSNNDVDQHGYLRVV